MYSNVSRLLKSDNVREDVNTLCTDHPEFLMLFSNESNLITEEKKRELYDTFSNLYPDISLDNLIDKYKKVEIDDFCLPTENPCHNVNIYDPQTKKFYNPNIATATKRTKPLDFNLADFLIQEQEQQKCFNLHFDVDRDDYFDLQDLTFEEKKKNDSATENSLKQVAKMALILNDFKDFPFDMLSVRGEERIL